MKINKFLCVFLAFIIISFLAVSAFCLEFIPSIYDVFGFIYSVGDNDVPYYTESQWNAMSDEERRAAFTNAVSTYHGDIIDPAHFYDTVNSSGIDLYAIYSAFVKDPLSPYANAEASLRIKAMVSLEIAGVADFGLGYYKPADNSVADTLNDDFLDYYKDNPLPGNAPNSQLIRLDNGYYIEFCFESFPCFGELAIQQFGANYVLFHIKYYNPDGSLYRDDSYAQKGSEELLNYTWANCILPTETSLEYRVPVYIYNSYGPSVNYTFSGFINLDFANGGKFDSVVSSDDGIPGTIEDDNGTKHNVVILPTGVLIDGDFYEFNPDFTVTYDNDTYNVYPDYSQVDNNYYQQFLEETLNYYYNYYNTPGAEFDDTNIIKSLQSIFRSLESFRSYTYSQLQQVISYLSTLPVTIDSAARSIISAIKSIKVNVSDTLDDDELSDLYSKLEKAVDKKFAFVISLIDIVKLALDSYKGSGSSVITFHYGFFDYTIDFSDFFPNESLKNFRFLIAAFLYGTFAFNTFRRIPSYINNGGAR